MSFEHPEFLEAFLRSVTLPDCLAWFEKTQDDKVREALKPLLFENQLGSLRGQDEQVLREELVRLAQTNEPFRQFAERESMAKLDRITAQYLEDQLDKLRAEGEL